MQSPSLPGLAKWPFFVANTALLAGAAAVLFRAHTPWTSWEIAACCGCVAIGMGFGILPFVLEYRMMGKVFESDNLSAAVSKIQNVETVASQIQGATAQWQNVHESAEKTRAAANEIADRMASEARGFSEFLQHANEGEKATLRLEVEKLRRAENEWLQVLVRMLDHVYAIHHAGLRSGNNALIEQLTAFQNACRDCARRVGLVPFIPPAGEPFDEARHRSAEEEAAPAGSTVAETMATGYTYQGLLLRPRSCDYRLAATRRLMPTKVRRSKASCPSRPNSGRRPVRLLPPVTEFRFTARCEWIARKPGNAATHR